MLLKAEYIHLFQVINKKKSEESEEPDDKSITKSRLALLSSSLSLLDSPASEASYEIPSTTGLKEEKLKYCH